MCLTKQSKTIRLGKDETYWKVFARRFSGELETIHEKGPISKTQGKANKKFDARNGYQVFETQKQAQVYSTELSYSNSSSRRTFPTYPVKKVLVKRGALKQKGEIGYGYICAGCSAVRVSSYTLCES